MDLPERRTFSQVPYELPDSPDLGIRYLSSIFQHTTNAYKFYWFLAILETVKAQEAIVSLDLLTAEMISQSWYPVRQFRLNFGAQDRLTQLVNTLAQQTFLNQKSSLKDVRDAVLVRSLSDGAFKKAQRSLQRYVPQRFLTPWFREPLKGVKDAQKDEYIRQLADDYFTSEMPPLYRFVAFPRFEGIEIHEKWQQYLFRHLRIIRAFVLWELVQYLYTRNPHTPNIHEKLYPPRQRDLKLSTRYWKSILELKPLQCIYSHDPLELSDLSIDHFLPWSFVGHDQLWNLVPTSKSVNSKKSDALPHQDYLEPFVNIHYDALQLWLENYARRQKTLEDFTNLYRCSVSELKNISYGDFSKGLKDTLRPLEQIAMNMGFSEGWRYP